MDRSLRNALRLAVTQSRRLLEDAIADRLAGELGIDRSGAIEDVARLVNLDDEGREFRADIVEHLRHIDAVLPGDRTRPKGGVARDTVEQLVREVAFTHFNRLCAFKLMEHTNRKLIRETIGRGLNSTGFKFYLADHPDDEARWTGGHQDVAYRNFLVWQGTQLAGEIGVLFDPDDPANRLFPKQAVLDQVLALINDPELASVWAEDEAIGWVYQYFTPKELRDQARKESAAPRNSYELAFRNQFFTPRYVVEFLVDNTLGRMWYEMLDGDTALTERCQYLVQLDEKVAIRERKDPRDLRLLDPAAGSGHFLLYCFDLLLAIYEEAWARQQDAPKFFVTGQSLHVDYPTLDALRRAVPGLILRHNLYTVDIDPRARQICALALWLRAQRAYQEYGLKRDARPLVERVNAVCAEPMPGEEELLVEFAKGLQPPVLGQLVQRVFERMRLAGEAGTLLPIEAELRESIVAAKRQWERPTYAQTTLFGNEQQRADQMGLFDVRAVSDEQFWDEAESRVLAALTTYAKRVEDGRSYRRRLFADDATAGFAFIDVCQRRYDVVLMNPPFGAASKGWKAAFENIYPRTKNDLYAAFVERGLALLRPGGMLGAITSRTGFFLTSFQKWREEILLREARPTVMADLGYGVLDTAMVETAAYCLGAGSADEAVFLRLLTTADKQAALANAVGALRAGNAQPDTFITDSASFQQVPGSPFAYWVSKNLRHIFVSTPAFDNADRAGQFGASTKNDFKFLRAWWEVSIASHARDRQDTFLGKRWVPFAKGGAFSRYYIDWELVLDWLDDGKILKEDISEYRGSRGWGYNWSASINGHSFYFRPGVTWPRRTQGGYNVRCLPKGCIFGDKGPTALIKNDRIGELCSLLGAMNSTSFRRLVELQMAFGSYELGVIQRTPLPDLANPLGIQLGELALGCIELKRDLDRANETSHIFHLPALLQVEGSNLTERAEAWAAKVVDTEEQLAVHQREIDDLAFQLYDIKGEDRRAIEIGMSADSTSAIGALSDADADEAEEGDEVTSVGDLVFLTAALVSYLVGSAFGRWDLRYATGEQQTPTLPDPFAPLPTCSPGMLTGEDGLPLNSSPAGYRLHIDGDGILVDDQDHPDDIVARARAALEVIFGPRAEAIEREACAALGVEELRDYLRRPAASGFWQDHIKRYSKSRRKAPIYWLLQSPKKNYGLWLYLHRLDNDTLSKALVNYVEPKLRLEEERIVTLRSTRSGLAGRELREAEREIERGEAQLADIREFRDRLERAVKRYLAPDLNDGVVLTIAPLHELVPWKEAKQYWDELLAGKYEWSSISKQLREKGLVR